MRKTIIKLFLITLALWLAQAQAKPNVRVNISGISGHVLQNVQTRLQLQLPKKDTLSTTDVYTYYQGSLEAIKAAMMPYGYFKPKIASRLTRSGNVWLINYAINSGPPLIIKRVDVTIMGEGAADPDYLKLKQQFAVKSGQKFSAVKYNAAKQALFDLAADRGYLAAKMLTSEVRIDLQHYSASIVLKFDTGPRYFFGPVTFSSNPYNSSFLHRYVEFQSDTPYSASKIQDLQQSLSNSDYFQQVLVTPDTQTANNLQVPINVKLIPRKSQQYLLGGGFGTDTGIRGLLGLELRRMTNTGQKLTAQILASQVVNTVNVAYTIPGHRPATQQYLLGAAISQENQVNGTGNLQKISASYLNVIKGWQQNLSLTLQREQYTLTNNPQETVLLLVPSINWSKTQSDNALKPTKGYHVDLTLLGATSAILSNTNFFQAQLNAKTITKLTKRDRLVLRGSLGYTAISDIDNLPLSFQLFAGGAQSIRGYGFNSIGPGDDLIIGSVELQHKVRGNWYGTIFYDAGNVSNSFNNTFYKSTGVGVLWQSPVGALELSVARPLDLPGHPISIEFSMGPEL